MKFHLSQEDLQQAIQNHVSGLIVLAPGAKMDIAFNADGTADINIGYMSVTSIPGVVAAKAAPPAPTPTPTPLPAPTPTPAPAAPQKIDLRTKEGRALKSKGLFDKSGTDAAPKQDPKPVEKTEPESPAAGEESSSLPADVEATTEVTDVDAANRAEEAKEILAEPDIPAAPVEEETPAAPVPEKPRRSLFGN